MKTRTKEQMREYMQGYRRNRTTEIRSPKVGSLLGSFAPETAVTPRKDLLDIPQNVTPSKYEDDIFYKSNSCLRIEVISGASPHLVGLLRKLGYVRTVANNNDKQGVRFR